MKWPLFLSMFLIILFGCQSERNIEHNIEDISDFYLSDTNRNYPDLREADSLIFRLQFDTGIDKYLAILEADHPYHIKASATYSIQELRFQYPYLYQKIDWDNNIKLDTSQMGFYFQLRNNPDLISLKELDSLMYKNSSLPEKIKAYTHHSIYSNISIESDYDIMYHHIQEAYSFMQPYGYDNAIGLEIINHLQKVAGYHRESLLGLSIVNNLIDALDKTDADEDILNLLKINQSNLYRGLGEVKLSRKAFDQIEAKYTDQPCHDHYHWALIGKLYLYRYDNLYSYDTVITKIKKAYSCNDRMRNLDRWLCNYYSDAYSDIKLGISYIEKAEEFELSNPFTTDGKIESIYYVQSELYEELNDYAKALNAYWSRTKKERSVQRLLDSKPYRNEWVMLARFASIYYNKWLKQSNPDDLSSAIALLLKAEASANALMSSTDESTLLSYKYYQQGFYKNLAQAYNDLYNITNETEYLIASIESLSKRKNLLLTTEILSQQNENNIPIHIQQEKKALEKQIAGIKQKYKYNHPGLESMLWQLNALNNTVLSYHQGGVDYYALNNRIPIDTIQTYLHEKSLISYNILDDILMIALINHDGLYIYKKEFSADIKSKLNKLAKMQADPNTKLDKYKGIAKDCYEYLFPEKMKSLLQKQLIIIPDGNLNYISFEALVDKKGLIGNNTSPAYLLHNYDISTLPSEQLLSSSNEEILLGSDSQIDVFSFSNTASIIESTNTSLTELPWAKEESQFIAEKYDQTNLYTGNKATVSQFVESLAKENDILHIATHGVSSSSSRYDVKLYFRNSDFSIDSIYGYELLGVDINTELIILTSCQSGTGAQTQGEGVYDIKRYLLAQGAHQVIVSLWDLDDQSSYNIMQNFYSEKSPNLRRAKIQFLEDYPHKSLPFYWAGLSS